MNTSLRKFGLAAALLSLPSLVAAAEKAPATPGMITASPGLVNRSIERLTLLPGPYLLSPARTTPTMAPAPMKLQSAPAWRFVREPSPTAASGSLRLVDPKPAAAGARRAAPTSTPTVRPPAETLRFDAKLESTLPRT